MISSYIYKDLRQRLRPSRRSLSQASLTEDPAGGVLNGRLTIGEVSSNLGDVSPTVSLGNIAE
jgi:hypothetical protein